MRIAIASYGQETSSFSPALATLDTFRQYGLYEGEDVLAHCRGVASVGGFLETVDAALEWEPVPIVISLDHHANLTTRMVENCDALVAHRTQPHDQRDTGRLAGRILVDIAQGKIRPCPAFRKIPLVTHQEQFLTSKGPMKEWFDLARQIETRDGVVSASTFPMQPWLDVPEGGWAVAVVTDDDADLARRCVDELARKAWSLRDAFLVQESIPPADAVSRAEAAPAGLVILSDTGDSVFGGATGDSTCLLAEMLRQNIKSPTLVPIVDAAAVATAVDAGVGATVELSLGGKLDTNFYEPVDVTATVKAIGGGRIDVEVTSHGSFDAGRAVLLQAGPIRIVVSEQRGVGGNHPVVYQHFGLDIADFKIAVLKTASNFQYYADWTSEVIRADTPGATMSNIAAFDWKHLPRPIYPLDPDAHL